MKKPVFIIFLTVLTVAFVISLVSLSFANQKISTENDAKPIYEDAKRFMAKFKMSVPRDILLRVESPDLVKIEASNSGKSGANVQAFYRPHSPEVIYIPSNLDETELFATLAHELTHAWQSSYCPLQDTSFKEGLASWITVQAYIEKGQSNSALSYLNGCSRRDPEEAKTVKRIMDIYEREGIDGVIKYVTKETRYRE